ncbi:SURF1 family protein [Rhizobacter sp. P5_C2]
MRPRRAALTAAAALLFAGFAALGTWQVQRLSWKLDLIERVEQRVRAAPVEAPAGPVSAATDEYRHVVLHGRLLHAQETLVQAVTEQGPGWWLVTPLQQADGRSVLVNRGFVTTESKALASRPDGDVTLTGLLRLTEPRGGFLRRNDPVAGRWFSRDVEAIAAARGLANAAPYFVDADVQTAAGPDAWPVSGLTVVSFHNNHLVYALTWFGLAAMVAGAAWMLRPGGRWSGENPPFPASASALPHDAPHG